jgi:hypothetical protein
MVYEINIARYLFRQLVSIAILFSTLTYCHGQIDIDTTSQQPITKSLITTESGTPLEDFYVDPIPNFSSKQDSIDYYSQLQSRNDSIAKVRAEQTANSSLKEEEEEEEDNGYGMLSMFQGNPGKAGLFSLVVPGLGQAYNRRWWKIPLAIGAEATAIIILADNIRAWNRWDTEYRSILAGNPPTINENINLEGARSRRNLARQNRDYAVVGLIAVHIIVAADAFVDRHLIEFDVDDDLSIKASPISPYPGLNIVMTF